MRDGWRERGRTHAKGHGDCTVLPFTSQEVAMEVFLSPKSPTVYVRKDAVGHSVCCLHRENRTGMCSDPVLPRRQLLQRPLLACLSACPESPVLREFGQSGDNTQSEEGFAFK